MDACGGPQGESAGVDTYGHCACSFPSKIGQPCAHFIGSPYTPCEVPRVAVLRKSYADIIGDISGHDSMASVMPWATRRWPMFHVEPEESDNIVAGRNAHLADVARRYPHVEDWGRHADPSKGLPLYGIRGDDCDCGVLHVQPVNIWAWLRRHARELLWDDTERHGRMPESRRSGTDASGAIGVDIINPLHRQWRARATKDPLDDVAYRAFRRRLRAASKLVVGAQPKPPLPCRLPRFRPYMLSDVRQEKGECTPKEKWEIDQILAKIDEQQRETPWALERRESDERGWAVSKGAHKASRLEARRRAMMCAEANVDAYAAGERDQATAAKVDLEKMMEAAREATTKMSEVGRWTWESLLQADTALEPALAALAKQYGLRTPLARDWLAREAAPLRTALMPWSEGRTGSWTAGQVSDLRAVSTQVLAMLIAEGPPKNGRPRDHEPWLVTWALLLAEEIAIWLYENDQIGLGLVGGFLREGVIDQGCVLAGLTEAEVVGGALHRATAAAIEPLQAFASAAGLHVPRLPTVPVVRRIVSQIGYGRSGSVRLLTSEIAATAYGVPRKAMDALVKKAAAR